MAALEVCLALRAIAGERIRLTLLAPGPAVVHRPAGMPDALARAGLRRLPLTRFAAFAGAHLHPDRLVPVDPRAGRVLTGSGAELPYDAFGIDLARPLMVQVARFDPWKNRWAPSRRWRMARESVPGLQLAMVGVDGSR